MEGDRSLVPIPVTVFAIQAVAVAHDRSAASASAPGMLWATAMALFLVLSIAGVASVWPRRFDTADYVAFGSLLGLANAGFFGYLLFLSGSAYRNAGALTERGREFLIITAALAGLSVIILLHGMACRRPLRP